MEFKLFYKTYNYKPSLKAMKQFKEATKKDLWSTLLKFMVTFSNSRNSGDSVAELLEKLSEVIDFIDAAQLFYALAKQENSTLTIDEVEDAMYHAGILPSTEEHDYSEPYPFVLYQVALEVQDYHRTIASEKKP